MSLFKDSKGGTKWWNVILIGVFVLLGIVALLFHKEVAYNFTHRFWRAGIWQILGPIAGGALGFYWYKNYRDADDPVPAIPILFTSIVLFFGGILFPSSTLRSNRDQGIPDVNLWVTKGKPINLTDSTQEDYFFKYYKLTPEDSTKTVETGIVPDNVDLQAAKRPASEIKF